MGFDSARWWSLCALFLSYRTNGIIRIALSPSLPMASFSDIDDPGLQVASWFAEQGGESVVKV